MIRPSFDPQQILELKHYRSKFWSAWSRIKPKNIPILSKYEHLKDDFFPRVIVNCKYVNCIQNGRSQRGNARIDRSFHCPKPSSLDKIQCHEIIADWLNYLYYLYSTQRAEDQEKEDIFWGTCAEDDAANKVLNECENSNIPLPTTMTSLNFTKAIRPRTGECVPYCKICEKIFG